MSSPQQTPNPQQTSTSSFASAAAAPARTGGNGNVETSRRKNPTASFGPIGTAIVIILIVAGIYYLGISSKPAEKGGWLALTSAWLSMMALLVALCVFLGWVISGRPLGILVGSRNLMSLSRFQMVAWSVVILSAVLAIAFRRIVTGMDPSDLGIDKHLWALLGISTASLVGTPLILQNKTTKDPDPKAVAQTATALQTTSGQTETMESIDAHRQGSLYVNPSIADARITDMFEGDEVGNTAYVDIAKVQMFLFTIITIVAYCYAIYAALAATPATLKMPPLSEGLIAMLGISHAGYLGSKTADHTPTSSGN